MSVEPALLAAIAAAPSDDLPRLVYADWLDENGRPLRAEFIRLQIEIARKETLPRAALNLFTHLWKRQQEILDHHRDELLGPLAGVRTSQVEFRRGFVDDITAHADDYFTAGRVVAALLPLPERIRVIEASRHPEHFFRSVMPGLEVVTDLSLPVRGVAETVPLGAPGIRRFRECCFWHRLRTLDLESCRLGDEGVSQLFSSTISRPAFPSLIELDLSFNDISNVGVTRLLNTWVPRQLKRFVLGGNPFGDIAAFELARQLAENPVLENLNLRMTNIGRVGQVALTNRLGGKVDLF